MREVLPQRRKSETFTLFFDELSGKFTVTLGYYRDGRIGEVFIDGAKAGSGVDSVIRDGAILISLGIQHGVPLDTMRRAISRHPDDRAATIVGAALDLIADVEGEP